MVPFTSFVALGELLNFPMTQFPYLQNKDDKLVPISESSCDH